MKTFGTTRRKGGFTLVELVTAMVLLVMVTLIVGMLLVYGQKHWTALFTRVYRTEAVDVFTAHRAFDSICRKASYRRAVLGSNNRSVELYYWDDASMADIPENYARFYLFGEQLRVEYGRTRPDAWAPDISRPVRHFTAAANVADVHFSVHGLTVQMILHYTDDNLPPTLSSAVRYNF